ncbi:MAG: hypothetical protein AAB592_03530 [Patescibacteria group bacterium]
MISSRKDLCAYCKVDITHLNLEATSDRKQGKITEERFRGTLFSFLHTSH